MKILLADDHHLVREAIASYPTRAAPDIACIEASDSQQVRERLSGDPRTLKKMGARNRPGAARVAMLQGMSGR
jgi:DNA-binding NarL/FixJ family response regulator